MVNSSYDYSTLPKVDLTQLHNSFDGLTEGTIKKVGQLFVSTFEGQITAPPEKLRPISTLSVGESELNRR